MMKFFKETRITKEGCHIITVGFRDEPNTNPFLKQLIDNTKRSWEDAEMETLRQIWGGGYKSPEREK